MTTSTDFVYILRACREDGTSYGDFKWPKKGRVEATDYDPAPRCGGGLHGWLWGEGKTSGVGTTVSDALRDGGSWRAVRVRREDVIDLGGKVKFPRGTVVKHGTRAECANWVRQRAPQGAVVIGATEGPLVGDYGTATAGARGAATAGNYGTATAGDAGAATAGNWGTATAGNWGTATATAGNYGTATAGNWGTATAGARGAATAGNYGTATAGNYGTATAGNWGTATAGERGEIQLRHWDGARHRTVVGYIGEGGLKPNTPYKLDDSGKFVKASS